MTCTKPMRNSQYTRLLRQELEEKSRLLPWHAHLGRCKGTACARSHASTVAQGFQEQHRRCWSTTRPLSQQQPADSRGVMQHKLPPAVQGAAPAASSQHRQLGLSRGRCHVCNQQGCLDRSRDKAPGAASGPMWLMPTDLEAAPGECKPWIDPGLQSLHPHTPEAPGLSLTSLWSSLVIGRYPLMAQGSVHMHALPRGSQLTTFRWPGLRICGRCGLQKPAHMLLCA